MHSFIKEVFLLSEFEATAIKASSAVGAQFSCNFRSRSGRHARPSPIFNIALLLVTWVVICLLERNVSYSVIKFRSKKTALHRQPTNLEGELLDLRVSDQAATF